MSDRLYIVASSSKDGTWLHPNAGEIVAYTFSDHDLPKEEPTPRYRPNLDDLADEARFNDSLIRSHRRRRETHNTTRGDLAMRTLVVMGLVAVVYIALVLFGIALS